ncbi:MAG: flagella basal body P-ring formation protein FlgA [Desulfobacterales bacterium]|nr:MAG: flagella basal body P-ring formation protein FlgA [Desulfobacterales bacterium]
MTRIIKIVSSLLAMVCPVVCWGVPGLIAETTPGMSKIVVHEFAEVQGAQIHLGQIADIEAIPFVRDVLEKISFGRSPQPGKIKTITRHKIESRIRSGRDLPGDIQLISPEKVYIKQVHQEISEQQIRDRLVQWLDDYFNGKAYEIKTLRIQQGRGLYPAGHLEFNLLSPLKVDRQGKLNVPLAVMVDQRKVGTLRIRGQVAGFEMVPCVKTDMKMGSAIRASDLVFVKKDMFTLHHSVVRDMTSFEGCRLKAAVKKGSPIRAAWLAPLPLIRKGDVVSLVTRTTALKIETSGIALEDGFKGRPLKVENRTSGKLVRGVAVTANTVEVVY